MLKRLLSKQLPPVGLDIVASIFVEERDYIKVAREDGWDIFTGNSVNYRASIGSTVFPKGQWTSGRCGGEGLLYAIDARSWEEAISHIRGQWPFSLFKVKGRPVVTEYGLESGFLELQVVEEIDVLSMLPFPRERLGKIEPFKKVVTKINDDIMEKYRQFQKVKDLIVPSVWNTVPAIRDESLLARIIIPYLGRSYKLISQRVNLETFPTIWAKPYRTNFPYTHETEIMLSSIARLAYAHYGWIVEQGIHDWEFVDRIDGEYPFQCVIDLLHSGVVPSFDGKQWRISAFDGTRVKTLWFENGEE